MTRRHIQIGLGVLWLLDAALQFQPFMFSHEFGHRTIAEAAGGQPGWVASGVNWAAGLISAHPVAANTLFATLQLAIAVAILYRPLARFGLAASVVWAGAVWYFGEGLGGLASGQASVLTGAPGAVVLYGLLAFVAWPHGARLAERGDDTVPPSDSITAVWAVVWVGGALLQLLPDQGGSAGLADAFRSGPPSWLGGAGNALASVVADSGRFATVLLVALMAAIGVAGLAGTRVRKVAAAMGAAVAVGIWLFAQSLGMITSGQATDPESGPLLVLLAAALAASKGNLLAATGLAFDPAPRIDRSLEAPSIVSALARRVAALASNPKGRLVALTAVPMVLAGCAAATPATSSPPSTSASMADGSMPGGSTHADHSTHTPATAVAESQGGPSASAQMICADETRRNVALLVGLREAPKPSATWADERYTCTYGLKEGDLVLSVQQSPTVADAGRYFADLRDRLGPVTMLSGIDSLGLPAFQTTDANVVFLKDNMTLRVDATRLPPVVGPTHDSRSNVAYSLATDIIACWRGN